MMRKKMRMMTNSLMIAISTKKSVFFSGLFFATSWVELRRPILWKLKTLAIYVQA